MSSMGRGQSCATLSASRGSVGARAQVPAQEEAKPSPHRCSAHGTSLTTTIQGLASKRPTTAWSGSSSTVRATLKLRTWWRRCLFNVKSQIGFKITASRVITCGMHHTGMPLNARHPWLSAPSLHKVGAEPAWHAVVLITARSLQVF